MNAELLKISIRQRAMFISEKNIVGNEKELNQTTSVLTANVARLGFTFSEKLLNAVNNVNPKNKAEILETLKEVTGVDKNWTPLVKGWDTPTNESIVDHIVTFFANVFKANDGIRLECGHLIPNNTFPLERYNGCPFCGTPFEFGKIEKYGQGTKLKVLELWNDEDLIKFYKSLLTSKTALDTTQVDSLTTLMKWIPIPKNVDIQMKETLMLVIDELIADEEETEAGALFKNPNEILRYLWYKHTGFLQIVEPKTIIDKKTKNSMHINPLQDESGSARMLAKTELKLKYSRPESKRIAKWLNDLELPVEKSCEIMHPKRGMWVRFIRALRLPEYSKKQGFEKLKELLDVFYNEKYEVWQGRVNYYRLKNNPAKTFNILQQRPGLFARSLFANMLWFGADEALSHFAEIAHKLPARLVLTLNMYAEYYFDKTATKSVKTLGGGNKRIEANKLLQLYSDDELEQMQQKIEDLSLGVIKNRFENKETENKTIFIDESLFKIPLPIGDRSETVHDLGATLAGTTFEIEGDTIRLFMQWGEGLPAMHLDMDLSCLVAYETKTDFCSYSKLSIQGCKHSGDIQRTPDKIGAAEYIDVDLKTLRNAGAKYVSFTCNAYTSGSLENEMVVGWMDSKYPMEISAKTGVAYDPSCVQHQVRITQTLSKGLLFGVIDVQKNEIIWLEMSFGGQVVQGLDIKSVKAIMKKLESKLTIGNLLKIKAEAQNLEIVEIEEKANEKYTLSWAKNPADVTQLFLD